MVLIQVLVPSKIGMLGWCMGIEVPRVRTSTRYVVLGISSMAKPTSVQNLFHLAAVDNVNCTAYELITGWTYQESLRHLGVLLSRQDRKNSDEFFK